MRTDIMIEYNRNLKENSRKLRNNSTEYERILWSRLKSKQIKSCQFYRQKIIGNYIADFYCAKANLVIELDGGDHYSDENKNKDRIRDDYMNSHGLKVLRFTNIEIKNNLQGVLEEIYNSL